MRHRKVERAATADSDAAERDRRVGWVAAYACGVAWAGIDPLDAAAEITDVTDGDPALIESALSVVSGLHTLDEPSRRRACLLLERMLADPRVEVSRTA